MARKWVNTIPAPDGLPNPSVGAWIWLGFGNPIRIRIRKCDETTQSVGAVFPRRAWEQETRCSLVPTLRVGMPFTTVSVALT
ncbi:hypothetical protein HYR99_11520 [Candidatus Poribacteria bacterium]|nr:hypothetical protein [Candidatus Poribacteria bacterium]